MSFWVPFVLSWERTQGGDWRSYLRENSRGYSALIILSSGVAESKLRHRKRQQPLGERRALGQLARLWWDWARSCEKDCISLLVGQRWSQKLDRGRLWVYLHPPLPLKRQTCELEQWQMEGHVHHPCVPLCICHPSRFLRRTICHSWSGARR